MSYLPFPRQSAAETNDPEPESDVQFLLFRAPSVVIQEDKANACPKQDKRRGFWDRRHGIAGAPGARDRERLERLCRYVARSPLAIDRLQLLPDGRIDKATIGTNWGQKAISVRIAGDVPPHFRIRDSRGARRWSGRGRYCSWLR